MACSLFEAETVIGSEIEKTADWVVGVVPLVV